MALKGIKVIELAGLAPAPFCGMILADFGASVIRVDKVGSQTDLDCLGNGKKSISLNLKQPKGIEILKSLCQQSDVLIEPFRKGVMENLGLGPQILTKENPRLIYARLTGYGQHGPYSNAAGHDINFVALSGLLSLFGRHGEKPIFPANLIGDFGGGGLMCALGIILALFERSSSGLGQIIDSSMTEGSAYLGSWIFRSQNSFIWGNERGRNILDSGAHFYEVYETKDKKFMAVGAIEPQFYKDLLRGLEISVEEAPHFDNFEESKVLFRKKFLEKNQEEWSRIFQNFDACVTPIVNLEDAPNFEHNKVRNSFTVTDEGIIPNPTPKLSRTPGVTCGTKKMPQLGEHTKEVLKTLNITEDEIVKLEKDNVIGCYKFSKL